MTMRLIAAVLVGVVSLSGAGCQSSADDHAPPGPAHWPESLADLSMVWTAEPGIDLRTAPAVPVRAYIESFTLGYLTGQEKHYLYPGFLAAADEPLRPKGASSVVRHVGTITNHLLSIDKNGNDITVIGCMYTYAAGAPAFRHEHEYEAEVWPVGQPESGITAFKVTLSAPTNQDGTATPQSGPARTPYDDVFGSYRITGYYGGSYATKSFDDRWPGWDAATAACIAKAPDPLERRMYLTTNFLPQNEFVTQPVSPGWPAKPAS